VVWCDDAYKAMSDADALVILTEWNAFRALDLKRVKALLKTPVMVDLRNIYKPLEMIEAGFHYTSVGRPYPPKPAESAARAAWRAAGRQGAGGE
jgi:UDPglucose 6-dehydrogenase